MEKIGNELASNFTISKSNELIRLKKLLSENINHLGLKWRTHLPVFLGPSEIARILWFDHVIKQIVNIPGIVVEFGSQFGASLSVLNNLIQIYDPWNASRKCYSFSTFEEGFVNVEPLMDGQLVVEGDYAALEGWQNILEDILYVNSLNSPVGINFKLFPGDACKTFEEFLKNETSTIIAMAHFDMDIYKPTKKTLELCLERMTKGSILVFDELNHPGFPGETIAVHEVLGINKIALKRTTFQPYSAYAVIE